MIAANMVMILCGATAMMTENVAFKWSLYAIGTTAMLLVFAVVWQILAEAIGKFYSAAQNNRERDADSVEVLALQLYTVCWGLQVAC